MLFGPTRLGKSDREDELLEGALVLPCMLCNEKVTVPLPTERYPRRYGEVHTDDRVLSEAELRERVPGLDRCIEIS